jgi:hypothetical protein
MTGRVEQVDVASGEVEVRVRGANQLGDHVSGSVRVALPAER